jgi:hypothetical protein
MTRREFTYLDSDQVADQIVAMVETTIVRRFPALSPLERDLLFAGLRDEIQAGLEEFQSGTAELVEQSIVEASNDEQ